jgi:hypothetical protein
MTLFASRLSWVAVAGRSNLLLASRNKEKEKAAKGTGKRFLFQTHYFICWI